MIKMVEKNAASANLQHKIIENSKGEENEK